MECPPGSSTLHHLNFINVSFGVRAPNWGGVFHQRTDQSCMPFPLRLGFLGSNISL